MNQVRKASTDVWFPKQLSHPSGLCFWIRKSISTTHIPSQRQESRFGKTWRFLFIKFGKIAIKVRIPYCDSHNTAHLDLLISFDASISSAMAFPHFGNSDHVILVSIDFPINSTRCPVSTYNLWLFSCWLGRSSRSFKRCSMGGYF